MWIRKAEFLKLVEDKARAHGEAAVLDKQNAILQSVLNQFALRLTQLEKERAQLLFQYTGVKVEFPRIEKENTTTPFDPMKQMPDFNDMGDALAKEHGIEWDNEGRVVYTKQKQA